MLDEWEEEREEDGGRQETGEEGRLEVDSRILPAMLHQNVFLAQDPECGVGGG